MKQFSVWEEVSFKHGLRWSPKQTVIKQALNEEMSVYFVWNRFLELGQSTKHMSDIWNECASQFVSSMPIFPAYGIYGSLQISVLYVFTIKSDVPCASASIWLLNNHFNVSGPLEVAVPAENAAWGFPPAPQTAIMMDCLVFCLLHLPAASSLFLQTTDKCLHAEVLYEHWRHIKSSSRPHCSGDVIPLLY